MDLEIVGGYLEYSHDARLARRWKRKCVSNTTYNKPSVKLGKRDSFVDQEYAIYLNRLKRYTEEPSGNDDNENDDNENDDNDPQYEMFLKLLREDGKSYVLDISIGDEMSMLLKYEEDNGLDDDFRHKTSQTSKGVSGENNVEPKRVSRSILSEEKKETWKILRSALRKGGKTSVAEKHLKKKYGLKVQSSSKPKRKHETGSTSITVDESYQEFLNSLKRDGDTLVLVTKDGKQFRYEEDNSSSSDSDSEIVAMDNVPYCDDGSTPFVSSKVYFLPCNGSSGGRNSRFRDELMNTLSVPFNQKEYEKLWQDVSERKPLHRDKILRGRTISFAMESVHKSYLDHHVDLAKKVKSVRPNLPRVLNLLRGFFYWLTNVSQDGSFKPWLDKSCLEVMPR